MRAQYKTILCFIVLMTYGGGYSMASQAMSSCSGACEQIVNCPNEGIEALDDVAARRQAVKLKNDAATKSAASQVKNEASQEKQMENAADLAKKGNTISNQCASQLASLSKRIDSITKLLEKAKGTAASCDEPVKSSLPQQIDQVLESAEQEKTANESEKAKCEAAAAETASQAAENDKNKQEGGSPPGMPTPPKKEEKPDPCKDPATAARDPKCPMDCQDPKNANNSRCADDVLAGKCQTTPNGKDDPKCKALCQKKGNIYPFCSGQSVATQTAITTGTGTGK